MAGHNAFQRNAFQRNAFQIVYEFTPTTSGGVIVGGDVTARFNSKYQPTTSGGVIVGGNVTGELRHVFQPATSGGVIVGGNVTAQFRTAGNHVAIVTGGVIIGGNVTARYVPIVPPVVRRGGAGPWRVINRFFRRPKRFKPSASGGVVVGGGVQAEAISQPAEFELEVVTSVFLASPTGGVVTGGGVFSYYGWTPPPPDSLKFRYIPTQPVVYETVPAGGVKLAGGVRAAFKKAPALIDYRVARLHKQIEEEDELLLLGAFDE